MTEPSQPPRTYDRGRRRIPLPSLATCCLAISACLATSGCSLLGTDPVEYEPRTLPSGVVILDLVVPEKGPGAAQGDSVAIEYDLFLADGELVDSTSQRGRPARFRLGAGEVPPGVEEGLRGMRLFGQRRITVPPHSGYGAEGLAPRIPPNATLRFEVELMELEPGPAADGGPVETGD